MRGLKNLPIQKKLVGMMMLITTTVLLIGFGLIIMHDIDAFKKYLRDNTIVNAKLVGDYCVSPLAFDDAEGAQDILDKLKAPLLQQAVLYDLKGNVFAWFSNANDGKLMPIPDDILNHLRQPWNAFEEDSIKVFQPIFFKNKFYGGIYIQKSTEELQAQINYRLMWFIVLITLLLGIAYLLAYKFQAMISQPISSLSEVTQRLSFEKNYTIRVSPVGDDEIGTLYQSFNNLLEELQKRDAELLQHQNQLEDLVDQRTLELRQAQAELVNKERLATIGQVTATVSHELRNPLGTIRLSIFSIGEKLRHKNLGIDKALERAERNIVRCDGIIRELLDYTRVSVLRLEMVNIDTWLKKISDDFTIPAGVDFVMDLQADTELYIDSAKLCRVMINLIDNACQAMQEDENVTTESLLLQSQSDGNKVELKVIDSGPGMSEEVLAQIFQPLFSTKGFGVGLGLPMVKQIIEQHHASIEVCSELGCGTTVTIAFPLKD